MADIQVATLNVRGINEQSKRQTLFHWLDERIFDIICLQETFITKENIDQVAKDWSGKMFLSTTDSPHSRGCAILFHKRFECEILDIIRDKDGRKILINLKHMDQIYSVINVYAPNNEAHRREFFNQVYKWIVQYSSNINSLIACGDFNCTLEEIDKLGGFHHIDTSIQSLNALLFKLKMKDVFRYRYPLKRDFTYYNKSRTIQSRIDYIFSTDFICNRVSKIYMLYPPRIPDHKIVVLKIKSDVTLGKGYWKCNVSHLSNQEYKELIRKEIQNVKQEMAGKLNAQQTWDLCKIRIKDKSIKFSSKMKQHEKGEIKRIEEASNQLEFSIMHEYDEAKRQEYVNDLEILKQQKNRYFDNCAKGAYIRSRSQYIEEGEKSNHFFLSLEKKRQTFNKISKIKCENGKTVYTTDEILGESESFYSKLYDKEEIEQDDIYAYIEQVKIPVVLDDDDNGILCDEITEKECFEALTSMSKNKSPGPDGLPVEFYLEFWNDIKDMVIGSYIESYNAKELSQMQRTSVTSLLFKKDFREYFKNYRPLTLSNSDYKIIAFVLCRRLQKVITKLISKEQSAYIKGRFIGENIRFLLDIIEYCDKFNDPGILLFLDFQKAFDSINWQFIEIVLDKFGFQKEFIDWFKTLYKNPITHVKINNTLSKGITIKRGIKQGCPLSALIFILCTEILCLAVKQNKEIKGITLPENKEARINQYADDTCLFLHDEISVQTALGIIHEYSSVSGLHLNLDKTEGLTVGFLRNQRLNVDPRIKWPTEPIRYLGIHIGYKLNECHKKNWTNKLDSMQKLIDCWRTRKLSIFGKITIIKSLLLPKITHPATVLEIPDEVIKNLNKMLYRFLWGATDRIKRLSVINQKKNMGIGMIDIESYFHSLHAAFFKRLYGNETIFTCIPSFYFKRLGGLTYCSNMQFDASNKPSILTSIPSFWASVILGFSKAKEVNTIETKQHLFNEYIWGNKHFIVNGKTLHSITFINANILKISDVLQDNGKLRDDIYNKLGNKHHYFRIIGMISKALQPYKEIRFSDEEVVANSDQYLHLEHSKVKSKYFYNILIKKKSKPLRTLHVWSDAFNDNIDWKKVYENKIDKQAEIKYAEFNYKIVSDILATNCKLYKWGKVQSNNCIYCRYEIHTTQHLLYDCTNVRKLWKKIETFFSNELTWRDILFGEKLTLLQNHVITIICFEIYKIFVVDQDKNIDNNDNLIIKIMNRLKSILSKYSCITSKTSLCKALSELIELLV